MERLLVLLVVALFAVQPAHQEHAVSELIKFLYATEAQRAYAKYGFRPVDKEVEKEFHRNKDSLVRI